MKNVAICFAVALTSSVAIPPSSPPPTRLPAVGASWTVVGSLPVTSLDFAATVKAERLFGADPVTGENKLLTDQINEYEAELIDALLASTSSTNIQIPTTCQVSVVWRKATNRIWFSNENNGASDESGKRCTLIEEFIKDVRLSSDPNRRRTARCGWVTFADDFWPVGDVAMVPSGGPGRVTAWPDGHLLLERGPSDDLKSDSLILVASNEAGDVAFWLMNKP